MHLREVLKKKVVGKVDVKFRIADSCMASDAGMDKTILDRIGSLKQFSAPDGVHYSATGYGNIAKNIITLSHDVHGRTGADSTGKNSASCGVSGSSRSHFWRGITSPVGSNKTNPGSINHKSFRERFYKTNTPYSRGGRRW